MAWNLVASASQSGPTSASAVTSAINTTGANLIVIAGSYDWNNPPTLSDSAGNTWTPLTEKAASGAQSTGIRLWYVSNPITSATHTFTLAATSSFPTICVAAWSGAKSSPFDVENGNAISSATTTIQTGSVTPTQANSLVIAAMSCGAGQPGGVSIDNGFTELFSLDDPAMKPTNYSYKLQTGAVNPTFTLTTSSDNVVAVIAVFKEDVATSLPFITTIGAKRI